MNLISEDTQLHFDEYQLKAINYLNKIGQHLITTDNSDIKATPNTGISKLKQRFFGKKHNQKISTETEHIQGLYLWGGVGRGKTWLMDRFFLSLSESLSVPPAEKQSISNPLKKGIQRIHFHEFMLDIHKKLQNLPAQPDPLKIVANDISQQVRLICLDEFHVVDIADAAILHGLLKYLFANHVILITTSNRSPDDLYKNGTHRERFLPAIELIKKNCSMFHLDSGIDYRKQHTQFEEVFFIPHQAATNESLKQLFDHYSRGKNISMDTIKIFGRKLPVVNSSDGCIWFSFDALCRGPRSSADYIYLAKTYKVIIVSEVPVLDEGDEGSARRFLNLIDAFYNFHVHLILSSSVSIKDMYQGDLLQFEFERATSRLHEMQSHIWWQDIP